MAIIALATVGKLAFATLAKSLLGMLKPGDIYERRRLKDREEECNRITAELQEVLQEMYNNTQRPDYTPVDAQKVFDRYDNLYIDYVTWIPQGRYAWEPHDRFDYPSARVGEEAKKQIIVAFRGALEEILYNAFPTYPFDYKEFAPPVSGDLPPVAKKSSLGKILLPLSLAGVGLFVAMKK